MNELPVLTPASISDDELRRWPLERLYELEIEMGRQCNVRCVMCCQTDFKPGSKQAEIVWKERLLPGYQSARELTISGGEATVIPGAKELLRMIMDNYPHLKLNCITNGLLFRGVWTEALAKQGKIVNISMNAIDAALYKTVVQFGRQKDVIENLKRLIDRRNELGTALKVRISTVVLDETIHEMATFIHWAADHGLSQVVFSRNQLGEITKYTTQEVQTFVTEAYAASDQHPELEVLGLNEFDWIFAERNGLKPVRPRQVFGRPVEACRTAFNTLKVDPFGYAFTCCRTWYYFGNLVKQTLQEVWQSKAAFRFRKRMLNLDFRDCRVDCEYNAKPIPYKVAQARKAYWVYKRDPKVGAQKTLRILGMTEPQIKLSEEERIRIEKVAPMMSSKPDPTQVTQQITPHA